MNLISAHLSRIPSLNISINCRTWANDVHALEDRVDIFLRGLLADDYVFGCIKVYLAVT